MLQEEARGESGSMREDAGWRRAEGPTGLRRPDPGCSAHALKRGCSSIQPKIQPFVSVLLSPEKLDQRPFFKLKHQYFNLRRCHSKC